MRPSWWRRWLGGKPSLGQKGEAAAARHLKAKGYRILGKNLRSPAGEIDILAQAPDGRTIVVVEVKTAGNTQAIRPEVHVDRRKERKLAVLAQLWLRRRRLADRPVRFDVIGVDMPPQGPTIIRHHEAAFESHF